MTTSGFKPSIEKYICISFEETETAKLAKAVEHLPGTAIKKLHVTLVHSFDAAKDPVAMEKWNSAMQLVGEDVEVKVDRYKQANKLLTAAEAILSDDLKELVASKVPHISLRVEKGVKPVESRFVLADDKHGWNNFQEEITLKGVVKLMGKQ